VFKNELFCRTSQNLKAHFPAFLNAQAEHFGKPGAGLS